MNDEEKRVQAILQSTFKKLEEMLVQQGKGKKRKQPASDKRQQGKRRTGEHSVGDRMENT